MERSAAGSIIEKEESATISMLTALYLKTESGYMGQVREWPDVVPEGHDLEECRASLKDALEQMVLAYREMGKEPPAEQALFEPLAVESI